MLRRHRYIFKAQIGRRKSETQDVGIAKIADHPARDKRLANSIGVRMAERELASPLMALRRTDEIKLDPEDFKAFEEEFG